MPQPVHNQPSSVSSDALPDLDLDDNMDLLADNFNEHMEFADNTNTEGFHMTSNNGCLMVHNKYQIKVGSIIRYVDGKSVKIGRVHVTLPDEEAIIIKCCSSKGDVYKNGSIEDVDLRRVIGIFKE